MGRSYRGQLIVARPELSDPNFDRTITIILEHGPDGAAGLILNRPSVQELVDMFPRWVDLATTPTKVYSGGPVDPDGLIAIAAGVSDGDLGLGLHTISLDDDPALAAAEYRKIRVFAGHAGWGPGQLEGEMANGAWWALDAMPEDVFTTHPDELWASVLGRADSELRWYAHYPIDVSSN